MKRNVHQLVVGASPGDAIFDQALLIRDSLREWGHRSEIYACHIHPSLEHRVPHFSRYHSRPSDIVIFHYSIGSELSDFVRTLPGQVMLIYHNVTPTKYLENVSHELAQLARQGREELPSFRSQVALALADSEYNLRDLKSLGFSQTGVLPIVLDEKKYGVEVNPELWKRYDNGATNLLFVGRIAPNKRQEDLIKIFYYYHEAFNSNSRLFLVGKPWDPAKRYLAWLHGITRHLGLEDDVIFTGHVPFRDMVTYYQLADTFLCMSDHEGFGKPLIESMYFGIPVVAFASTAVPYTLGDAGILVHERDHPLIAALVDELVTNTLLRQRILAGERHRFQAFRQQTMVNQLRDYLGLLLDGSD